MLDEEEIDTAVLGLLLEEERLWSVDEVVREIGAPAASDSLARLYGTGLVRRCGEFVFVTRAAVRASEIVL